jgi:Sec-independent protein translocase protein TatA
MESHRSVQLGCGTFVIIVIIVIVFGNVAAQDLQRDMASLRNEMRALRDSVRVLQKSVEELRDAVLPAKSDSGAMDAGLSEDGAASDDPPLVFPGPPPPLPVDD